MKDPDYGAINIDGLYYAWQLVGRECPSGFDKALTIEGLISQGQKHWPSEWEMVLSSARACRALLGYITRPNRPPDLVADNLFRKAAQGIATEEISANQKYA